MRSKFAIVMWACLTVGCIDHAQQHGENVKKSAEHVAALEKCLDDAIATRQATGDANAAGDEYVECADKADKTYGRKK